MTVADQAAGAGLTTPAPAVLPVGRGYQPIARLVLLPGNPRLITETEFKRLMESIRNDPRFLLRRPPLIADGPKHHAGRIVYGGNMRVRALAELFKQGWMPPDDLVQAGWRQYCAPVDVDDIPEQQARERALQDNNSWGTWDEPLLSAMVQDLNRAGSDMSLLGFRDDELQELLAGVQGDARNAEAERKTVAGRRPARRIAPLDMIFTFAPEHAVSHVARAAGFLIGIRSTDVTESSASQYTGPISFVDNEFKDYDHGRHRDVVGRLRPKYATVRDIMTKGQCDAAGITYYPLDQILRWAEDLEKYAQRVIVIPKFDCIADIPPQYVLGYSVPSSYGGTPVPITRFKGRNIHLLGGRWADQLGYLAVGADDVVSIDTNVAAKAALWGTVYKSDGSNVKLEQDLGIYVNNAFTVGVAISLGAIARAIYEIFPADDRVQPEQLAAGQEDDDGDA